MSKKKKTLRLGDYSVYYPANLAQLPAAELKQEYNRLRGLVQSRMEALSRSEFTDTQGYLKYKDRFSKPAGQLTHTELIYELSELATAATSAATSVRGLQRQRKETYETLKEHGYNIQKKDVKAFGEFMQAATDFYGSKVYDSPRVAELFAVARKKGLDPAELTDDLNYWQQHVDDLKHARKYNSADHSLRTVEDYRQAIDSLDRKRNRH